MEAEARTERRRAGDAAESAAAAFLEARGMRVRERNFHCREGEIDIVAEHGDVLCFVEVRMRSTDAWGDPALTVSRGKQRRVVKAALRYLFRNRLSGRAVRFDVVSVVGRGPAASLEHIPDAFDAGM